jgi:WD40 repeat protein
MTKKIIELQNDGLNMHILNNNAYIRNGKNIHIYDLATLTEIKYSQIFKKDGKARSFFIQNSKIYLRDFCSLYELDCDTLETIRVWKLGEDLTSDICAETGDDDKVYACIRGGKITVIDLKSNKLKQHIISDSSMWDIRIHNINVYLACVNGELVELNKGNMTISKKKQIHKKNIYKLLIHKDIIYSVSQDQSFIATGVKNFETIYMIKKAISNMSIIVGIYENNIVTSNPNKKEITIWDINGLKVKQILKFPTNRNGVYMKDNKIYGSDKDGIYRFEI